jgi:DNA repair protein RadD
MDKNLVSLKSQVLVDLEAAKFEGQARSVLELASRAAVLEGQLARQLILENRPTDAIISLISQASCFGDANRLIEKQRILEFADTFAAGTRALAWIRDELRGMSNSYPNPAAVFEEDIVRIEGNTNLRRPQIEAYAAAKRYFRNDVDEHAIIQLPVGCGKTGTIAILPFGISRGRVLVVAPNLIIRDNLLKNLDSSHAAGFLRRTGVITSDSGPSCALLDENANIRDCDEAAIVVANIQQLVSRSRDKWLAKLPGDFFDLIVMDEGHHNVAPTWQQSLAHFPDARVTSFTATPFRADGRRVIGKRIYRFPIVDAIKEGYIKDVASHRIEPRELTFVYKGETTKHSLEEVMKLKENDWFSKGVALSPECNRGIVDHSITCLEELRSNSKSRHTIIAVACSIDHARAIRAMYEERRLKAEVIHSDLVSNEQVKVLSDLELAQLDAVVQVQMLGEGADYPHLSVAAIFRPFRHLVPYVQFVGRIMRVAKESSPGDPDNKGYVVSHVGLNVDRWWTELKDLDESDKEFFENLADGNQEFLLPSILPATDPGPRRRFMPSMVVLEETIAHYITDRFMPEDAKAVADDVIEAIQLRGLDLGTLGLSREALEIKIRDTMSESTRRGSVQAQVVQPQRARQIARQRLDERVRSASKELLNELGMNVVGRDLPRLFPRTGATNNISAGIILLNQQIQLFFGLGPNERDIATTEQLVQGHNRIDELIDTVAKKVREKQRS